MTRKEIAELIVRSLDLASPDHFPYEHELGSIQLVWADEIKRRYSDNKSKRGYDFTRSAWEARVSVVEEILNDIGKCIAEVQRAKKS